MHRHRVKDTNQQNILALSGLNSKIEHLCCVSLMLMRSLMVLTFLYFIDFTIVASFRTTFRHPGHYRLNTRITAGVFGSIPHITSIIPTIRGYMSSVNAESAESLLEDCLCEVFHTALLMKVNGMVVKESVKDALLKTPMVPINNINKGPGGNYKSNPQQTIHNAAGCGMELSVAATEIRENIDRINRLIEALQLTVPGSDSSTSQQPRRLKQSTPYEADTRNHSNKNDSNNKSNSRKGNMSDDGDVNAAQFNTEIRHRYRLTRQGDLLSELEYPVDDSQRAEIATRIVQLKLLQSSRQDRMKETEAELADLQRDFASLQQQNNEVKEDITTTEVIRKN